MKSAENIMNTSEPSNIADSDVAVIGMAGKFPGANSIDAFWKNLRDGVESVTFYSDRQLRRAGVSPKLIKHPDYVKAGVILEDIEMFDAGFFGFSPKDASIMDPQHRFFLECAWEALEAAGYTPEGFDGSIGVYGGCGMNAYMMFNLLSNPALMEDTGLFLVRHTGNDKDFLTTRVSYTMNLTGPSISVQTACSTSLVAIHMAAQSLINGECDMALAGGVTIELPQQRMGYLFEEGEILSPDGHCHSFDHLAQGTIFGSGVGIVVLKRLEEAIEEGDTIHAVIKGSAINNDGSAKVSYLAPSVDGQAGAIAEALAMAEVDPETISYVEAHGTGTPIGDPIEVAALTQAFRDSGATKNAYCALGSVKSNIGHLDTAAGVAAFIKTVLALTHRQLPPSLNFDKPNPKLDLETSPFFVNYALQPWKTAGFPRRAGVSSLGVGGTNAHVILEEAPPPDISHSASDLHLLTLSARSTAALTRSVANLGVFLQENPHINIADAAYTLQQGRRDFSERAILICKSAGEGAEIIAARDPQRLFSGTSAERVPAIAFLFPGGGAQYPNMGVELFQNEPVYREIVTRALNWLQKASQIDLKSLMFPLPDQLEQAATELQRPANSILSIFITECAMAELLISHGIEPGIMIGHSLGEYAAAYVSGVFSLEDALKVVKARGDIFEKLPAGAMLSVSCTAAQITPMLEDGLTIAVVNSPEMCVISGDIKQIERLEARLEGLCIEANRVRISVAAHSAMLDPFLDEFRGTLTGIRLNQPARPFVSNLSGKEILATEAMDVEYWVAHLRQTVHFADGLNKVLAEGSVLLLEVGPGNTLSSLARLHPAFSRRHMALNSMRHPRETTSCSEMLLRTLGGLWLAGCDIDWSMCYANEKRRRIPLPTYPFERQPYWIEAGKAMLITDGEEHTLNKIKNLNEWFYQPVWVNESPPAGASLKGTGSWLVIHSASPLHLAVIEALKLDNAAVISAADGPLFQKKNEVEFQLNITLADQYGGLLQDLDLTNRLPERILYLPPLDHMSAAMSPAQRWQVARRSCFDGLLALARAIGNEGIQKPIRIEIISNGMQTLPRDGDNRLPEKSVLLGPCRVMPKELPRISCRSIDLDVNLDQEATLAAIAAGLSLPAEDTVISVRGGGCQVLEYSSLSLKADQKNILIRPEGVYLLTGGLGGIALSIARDLAQQLQPVIILASRRSLPARETWDEWLKTHPASDRTSEKIRGVQEIEAAGSQVALMTTDITLEAQVETLMDDIEDRFGRLDGIIHAAGVIDDSLILLKDTVAAHKVLAPKIEGTIFLSEAAARFSPEFVVLFSSVSSISGPLSQVDYTAANAFLDNFAQSRSNDEETRYISVNWGQWRDVGMAAALARELGIVIDVSDTDESTTVHPLLHRLVRRDEHQSEYMTILNPQSQWILAEHQSKSGDYIMPGTAYLELACAALADRMEGEQPVEIFNLYFLSPIVLNELQSAQMHVFLTAVEDHYEFVVKTRPDARTEADWTEHVRGNIRRAEAATAVMVDIEAIRLRCNTRTETRDNRTPHEFMNFGPRWKCIDSIWFAQNEALAFLKLPEPFQNELVQMRLHPALLDMATGCAQSLSGEDALKGRFFVPFAYSRVKQFADLKSELYSHIRCTARSAGEMRFDVDLYDLDGQLLLSIEEFTMKRLAVSDPAKRVEPAATRKGSDILAMGQKHAIRPAEGAQALRRIIGAGIHPQVIVSSQRLESLIRYFEQSVQAAEESGRGLGLDRPNLLTPYVEPADDIQTDIAVIWQDILGIGKVGVNDDFIELGGHSLLLTQIILKVKKKYNVKLDLGSLFENPTVFEFARAVKQAQSSDSGHAQVIKKASRDAFKIRKSSVED